jgi:hypothetical protein
MKVKSRKSIKMAKKVPYSCRKNIIFFFQDFFGKMKIGQKNLQFAKGAL